MTSNNTSKKKSCKTTEVTGWNGSFYLSKAKKREQVLLVPNINGVDDNHRAIQLGTVDRPLLLFNTNYGTYEDGPENGKRLIHLSMAFDQNAEYESFFETVDEELEKIRENHCTPNTFKSVYGEILDEIRKTWTRKREEELNQIELSKCDQDGLSKAELRNLKKEISVKVSGIVKEEAKKHVEKLIESGKVKQDFDNKVQVTDYEPILYTSSYIKNGTDIQSTSVKLNMAFEFDNIKEEQKSFNITNFSKLVEKNGKKKLEPITFFDLPTGKEKAINAIISIKLLPMTYRKNNLSARFFIHDFIMVENSPVKEISSGIDLGDDEIEEEVNTKKRSFSEVEDVSQNDDVKKRKDEDGEKKNLINEEDLAMLNDEAFTGNVDLGF